MKSDLSEFKKSNYFAVVGVSRNQKKFGNYLFEELTKKGKKVYPINPYLNEYFGKKCFNKIDELPKEVECIIFITKPDVTNSLLTEVIQKGIKNIWLQQGSHNQESIDILKNKEVNFIYGQCLLMYLEPVNSFHKFHRFIWKIFGKYLD